MQEYELKEFLKTLNRFYPFKTKDADVIKSKLEDYKNTILNEMRKTDDKYDFDHLFNLIKKNYEYKIMPNIPFILKYLPISKVKVVRPSNDEGKTLLFIKTRSVDGKIERDVDEFVICNSISTGITKQSEYFKKLRQKWDDVTIRIFPEGWHFKGDKVYPPSEDEVSEPITLFQWAN